MSLEPKSYEERLKRARKNDQWRRESARRYEDSKREEGKKFSDMERSRLSPVNSERREKEFERAYGGEERVRWVQDQPCLSCKSRPSENAHVETGGMGRKADADTVVPLCRDCHRLLHRWGSQTWQEETGVDLKAAAERLEERWQAREETGG